MSQDLIDVMEILGHEKFYVAGHDRGARTAHRMALDHPTKILIFYRVIISGTTRLKAGLIPHGTGFL